MPDDRSAIAERLRDYFSLQLRFAAHLGARSGLDLPAAVLRYTNLHRRFGLGDPGQTGSAEWQGFSERLDRLPDHESRAAWASEFYRHSPEEVPLPDRPAFGCFSCEAPDADGVLRIHFENRDQDGLGPLDRSKQARRQAELAALFGFVRQHYPAARMVKGVSWLYHREAYRRLFPPEYGESAAPPAWLRLNGSSSWGQFLRHDGSIRPALRDEFLRRFDDIDVAAPWRSFPLPALLVSAPVGLFFERYLPA